LFYFGSQKIEIPLKIEDGKKMQIIGKRELTVLKDENIQFYLVDENQEPISDANVFLVINHKTVEKKNSGERGDFNFSFHPQPGDLIKIKALKKGYLKKEIKMDLNYDILKIDPIPEITLNTTYAKEKEIKINIYNPLNAKITSKPHANSNLIKITTTNTSNNITLKVELKEIPEKEIEIEPILEIEGKIKDTTITREKKFKVKITFPGKVDPNCVKISNDLEFNLFTQFPKEEEIFFQNNCQITKDGEIYGIDLKDIYLKIEWNFKTK
jgi:hypothetical protein